MDGPILHLVKLGVSEIRRGRIRPQHFSPACLDLAGYIDFAPIDVLL